MAGNPNWVKGQSGNPAGRKPKAVEEKYLQLTVRACSLTQWRKIVKKVIEKAERGERWAVEFLADRLMGKARQPVDIGLDEETAKNIISVIQHGDPT